MNLLPFAFALTAFAASTHEVKMKSISFEPKVLEIQAGDTVVWKNISYTEHSATEKKGGGFDTGLVKPKHSSKIIRFPEPGEFRYLCSVHGKTMSAVIHVRAVNQ